MLNRTKNTTAFTQIFDCLFLSFQRYIGHTVKLGLFLLIETIQNSIIPALTQSFLS